VSPAATLVEALGPIRSEPARSAVLLDIDGTLAPIVRHADDAHVPEATRAVLIEVSRRYGVVGCVSGRRAATARAIVAIGTIAYVGNHGAELLRPGSSSAERAHP
jgi:trehalose 6-phosphate phosphatase